MPNSTEARAISKQLVMLMYHGSGQKKLILADRTALADSCPYFKTLLEGSFKEKNETCIDINLGHFFSPEVFESVVRFIESGHIDANKPAIFYRAMLDMAQYLILADLGQAVESVLINRICLEEEVDIHTIANVFNLSSLRTRCEEFERDLETSGMKRRDWPRCTVDGHDEHWCLNCPGETRREVDDENWDIDPDL